MKKHSDIRVMFHVNPKQGVDKCNMWKPPFFWISPRPSEGKGSDPCGNLLKACPSLVFCSAEVIHCGFQWDLRIVFAAKMCLELPRSEFDLQTGPPHFQVEVYEMNHSCNLATCHCFFLSLFISAKHPAARNSFHFNRFRPWTTWECMRWNAQAWPISSQEASWLRQLNMSRESIGEFRFCESSGEVGWKICAYIIYLSGYIVM